jgi:hypothetical protein
MLNVACFRYLLSGFLLQRRRHGVDRDFGMTAKIGRQNTQKEQNLKRGLEEQFL